MNKSDGLKYARVVGKAVGRDAMMEKTIRVFSIIADRLATNGV